MSRANPQVPPHESPEAWFTRQPRRADRDLARQAVRELYQRLALPEPTEILWSGSPKALAAQLPSPSNQCPLYEKLLQTLGCYRPGQKIPADLKMAAKLTPWDTRPRELLQYEWDMSGPGRRLTSRVQLIAHALQREPGPRADLVDLYQLGLKEICRGVVPCDPVPWSLNLDRFWRVLYTIDVLEQLGTKPPEWSAPLKALVLSCGFLAAAGTTVWLAEPPQQTCPVEPVVSALAHSNLFPEGWTLAELAHETRGPALTWPDGWSIWAWQGRPVPRQAIETPERMELELLLTEPDDKIRRILIERRGRGLLNEPGCPAELKSQARQVFLNQYDCVTREELPSNARPWPEGVEEPRSMSSALELPDGSWYALYPDGQVRVAARARNGHVLWLVLEHGVPCGYVGDPPGGQAYYWNGYLEDFSPWDDVSLPYPSPTSFGDWVRASLDAMFSRR